MYKAYTRKSADCRRKVSKVDIGGLVLWWILVGPLALVAWPMMLGLMLADRATNERARSMYALFGILLSLPWWLFWVDFFGLIT